VCCFSHHLALRAMTGILCARSNQLNNCVAIGTPVGLRLYSCNPFSKCFESLEGGMAIVQMLFCTSLVAQVGAGSQPGSSPRHLRLFNTKTNKPICELTFPSTVLNVLLNMARLVVVLETKIHIFDLRTMKVLHQIDTSVNATGACALSISESNCFLAYPSSSSRGDIFVYDVLNLQLVNTIRAHNSPVHLFAFNQQGTMLATVSDLGTVVRVWSIPEGTKLFTFRRGTYSATVTSVCFNPSSTLLSLSSKASSTIHVFALNEAAKEVPAGSRVGVIPAALNFMPTVLHDIVEPSRCFARIDLKDSNVASACGFYDNDTLMVVTVGGHLCQYVITDGTCRLAAEYSLLDSPSEELEVRLNPAEGKVEQDGKS